VLGRGDDDASDGLLAPGNRGKTDHGGGCGSRVGRFPTVQRVNSPQIKPTEGSCPGSTGAALSVTLIPENMQHGAVRRMV